ncbi:serine hydrolase [Cellvibrio sp. pealriver]|uniref:serine hydrolase domain-containing protein n=1 Tax=Cellvibrio sp. pealriver TaxID=1622269 RepID=UPI00066FC200|nr:serine hydrolase [Cellvibrio sp. pealriver]
MRFIAALLSTIALCASLAKAETETSPQTLEELKVAIEKIRTESNTPAVGIALVGKDGPLWIAGFGQANIEQHTPADENTLFRIGSVSKMIVALAALQLIEKGKLSLDDKLSTLAPEIEFYNPWETENPIKIVHLLEHTTGWDNTHPKELTLNVDANTPLLDILNFHPHSRQSRWQPGTRMAYNNIGPVVIAYLIEKISGQSFSHYVRESIFIPLGMQKTHYFPNEIINFTQTTPLYPRLSKRVHL